MLISRTHQFIFVHVPKVAGSSIRHALRPWAVPEQQRPAVARILRRMGLRKQMPETSYLARLSLEHHSIARMIRHALPDEFGRYFTFAFVRNPWDWHVSYYTYVTNLSVPEDDWHIQIRAAGSFTKYVEEIAPHHNFQQKAFVVDENGQCMVDYIGRYETLDHDFLDICQRLSIPAVLPRSNESRHRVYREYYDEATRRALEPTVKADCEYFCYTF